MSSRLSIEPPKPAPDRSGLTVVAVVWNEGRYLKDWLAFHKLAGISSFIIYDMGSTDDTVAQLQAFNGCPVTIIPWGLRPIDTKSQIALHQQNLAYTHAIQTFGPQHARFACIDIDEFLVPVGNNNLNDALSKIGDPANLSLPWSMFGHNGHKTIPKDPVPFAFTDRAAFDHEGILNFKCIFDPCEVTEASVHKFKTRSLGTKSSNSLGKTAEVKARNSSDFLTRENIQLNHYYLRSEAELREKYEGFDFTGVEKEKRMKTIFAKRDVIEENPMTDRAALDFLARQGYGDVDDFIKYRDGLFR